jgi:allantoicase
MGDGWETRRRREPGNDWVILKLGHPGRIQRIEVDTSWFKGNYPARCSLRGLWGPGIADAQIGPDGAGWVEILAPVDLGPDRIQVFEGEVAGDAAVSHVLFEIHPDGGVSRLRLFGRPEFSAEPES